MAVDRSIDLHRVAAEQRADLARARQEHRAGLSTDQVALALSAAVPDLPVITSIELAVRLAEVGYRVTLGEPGRCA